MERRDQRLQLRSRQELHLVKEQHESPFRVLRSFPHGYQQIGEVSLKFLLVGEALCGVNVDPSRQRSGGVDRHAEGLQHGGSALHSVAPAGLRRHLEQRGADGAHHLPPELLVVVFGHLALDHDPAEFLSRASEPAEQHGLPDASEARDDHGLLSAPGAHPTQQQVERVQLRVAAAHRRLACRGSGSGPRTDLTFFMGVYRLIPNEGVAKSGASVPGRGRGLPMMGVLTLPTRKTPTCLTLPSLTLT